MKYARWFLVLSILIIGGIAALYLVAPLGFEGTSNENVSKLNDIVFNQWNQGEAQIATYSLLSIEKDLFPLFQDNTWWSFGLLSITFLIMMSQLLSKSVWSYVFIGLIGILVACLASFLGGGLLILLAILGIVNNAVSKRTEEKKKDYTYLYREYI